MWTSLAEFHASTIISFSNGKNRFFGQTSHSCPRRPYNLVRMENASGTVIQHCMEEEGANISGILH